MICRHKTAAKSTRRDAKGDIPIFIQKRNQRQHHFSGNLGPHVKRVTGVFPIIIGKGEGHAGEIGDGLLVGMSAPFKEDNSPY